MRHVNWHIPIQNHLKTMGYAVTGMAKRNNLQIWLPLTQILPNVMFKKTKVSSLHGHPVTTRSNVLIPSVPLFQGFPVHITSIISTTKTSSCMCIYYCFIICAVQSYPLCGSRWLIFQESGHPCHLRRVNGPQASHGLICYTRRGLPYSLLPGTLSPLPGSHKLLRARPHLSQLTRVSTWFKCRWLAFM